MVVWQDQFAVVLNTAIILSQLSMLWKDNPFFRWGTRMAVGYTLGYSIPYMVYTLNMYVWQPTKGLTVDQWWLIGVFLGLLLYFRLSRPHAWIAKYPLAVQLGVGVGITAVQMLRAQVLDQIAYTVRDIFNALAAADSMALLNSIVIFAAMVTTISYFLFTREQKGVLGATAWVGRAFIMSSIAVIWAGDYVWAMAMLTGTLYYIINNFFRGLLLGGMR